MADYIRDQFKNALESGKGYLLVPRGGALFIPFSDIQKVINDPSAYKQNTIDIYIDFKEDRTVLSYTNNVIDVTNYKIVK